MEVRYESDRKALALAGSIGGKDRLNCIAELDGTAAEQAREQVMLKMKDIRRLPGF